MRVNISGRSEDDIELTHHPKSFVWDPSMSNCLRDVINSDEVQNKLNSLFTDKTSYNVDHLVDEFTKILSDSCHRILPFKKQKKTKRTGQSKLKNGIIMHDCYVLKKNLRNLGNLLTMYPDDTFLRHLFFAKKKEYKRFIKKQKRQFHSALLDKIDALADKNPKEYWKLVNSIKANQTKKVSDEISSSEWFEYFKNLNKGASLYTEESSILKPKSLKISIYGPVVKMTSLMSQFQLMKYVEFLKN